MNEAMRRIFFALWPDDAVRQALFHWQTHNLSGKVRWSHRADLHLTLHFLGMVDEARIDELCRLGHEKAGSARERLVEVHGTNLKVECMACHQQSEAGPHFADFERSRQPGVCGACGGWLKPATISFGLCSLARRSTSS
mgnify:CR=1 FL=1